MEPVAFDYMHLEYRGYGAGPALLPAAALSLFDSLKWEGKCDEIARKLWKNRTQVEQVVSLLICAFIKDEKGDEIDSECDISLLLLHAPPSGQSTPIPDTTTKIGDCDIYSVTIPPGQTLAVRCNGVSGNTCRFSWRPV